MEVAVVIGVLLTALLKVADFGASAFVLAKPDSSLGRRLRSGKRVELDWTPVFAWAEGARAKWRRSGLKGSVRDRAMFLFVEIGFRSPVLAVVQAGFLLWSTGTVEGGAEGGCFASQSGALRSWQLAAGISCVLVAFTAVAHLLLAAVLRSGRAAQGRDIRLISGHFVGRTSGHRSLRGAPPTNPLSSIIVIPGVSGALILSYSAFYLAFLAADPSAFNVPLCEVNWVGALYFSAATAATIGSGEIVPMSDPARLSVISEVFMFVTMLALFVQSVQSEAPDGGSGDLRRRTYRLRSPARRSRR